MKFMPLLNEHSLQTGIGSSINNPLDSLALGRSTFLVFKAIMSTATVLDVARTANVSIGTVSRVLNKHPSVSPENLSRVQQAIEQLNYSPRHRKASMAALNPLENKNVLLLMLGMDRSLAALPVVASAIDGVEQAISSARAHLLIANVPAAHRVPQVLLRKRLGGVILKGAF